jgi:hypothetical protein
MTLKGKGSSQAPFACLLEFIMNEWFKPIEELRGFYLVSNLGNVFSNKTKKILKTCNTKGYRYITIYTHNGQKTFSVHRLVAKAFIENKCNKPYINHINENKSDNMVSNLEWCTHLENMNHGTRNARISMTAKKKPVARCDFETGEVIQVYESTKEAFRDGYNRESVSRAARGIHSHHKGFKWKFL